MPKLHAQPFLFVPLLLVLLKMQSVAMVPSECQDVWRIDLHANARCRVDEQHFGKLKYYRWQNNRWQLSDAETFFDTQQAVVPVSFFALGFTLTTSEVTQTGFDIVRNFAPNKPCRVVFLDWYSERTDDTYRRDIRKRLPITDNTGDYTALLLQKLKPQSKACLFGFSLGNRIVCGAAETLRKNGRRPEGLRLHLVISGSATDACEFAEGQRYSEVPQAAEKIMVTYNPSDTALRFYHAIYGCLNKTAALGLKGLPIRSIDSEYQYQFENINIERYVGSKHQTLSHVQSPPFRSRINTYFFFE